MKRFVILFLWAFSLQFAAIGEERGGSEASIYGHVIDKGTGEHVPYVMVSLKGTVIGTATAG